MKNTVLILSIILLSVLLTGAAYISENEDICCKYSLCTQLTNICVEDTQVDSGYEVLSVKGESMYLENLKDGDAVKVGTEIRGKVMGSWFFEGVFPVRVFNSQGEIIDTLIAQSSGDWMTEDLVNFSFILDIEIEQELPVLMRFERSNPSDLEESEDYVELNIVLLPIIDIEQNSQTSTVKVFFPNSMLNTEMIDCSLVFPVTRAIEKTQAVGRASLEELFKGLTQQEQDEGFFTNINEGVIIQSLTIENGVAKVDLNSRLEQEVGGSCKVESITAQITETLKQFPTVDSVIISIDGRTEDILQP